MEFPSSQSLPCSLTCNNLPDWVGAHRACEGARATTAAPLPVFAALRTGRAWPAAGGLLTWGVEWHQADPEGREYLEDSNHLLHSCLILVHPNKAPQPPRVTAPLPTLRNAVAHRRRDISHQSQPLQRSRKCSHQKLDVGAFHAREVAALAMGWGWSQVGRENVPGGVQLLKDPPVDEQVLLSLRQKERKHPSAAWGVQRNCQGKEHKASRNVGSFYPLFTPSLRRHRGQNSLEHQGSHSEQEAPQSPSLCVNLAEHKDK